MTKEEKKLILQKDLKLLDSQIERSIKLRTEAYKRGEVSKKDYDSYCREMKNDRKRNAIIKEIKELK